MPHLWVASKLDALKTAPFSALAGIGFTVLGGMVFAGSNASAKYTATTYPAGQTLFLLAPLIRPVDISRIILIGEPRLTPSPALAHAALPLWIGHRL